MAYINGQHFSWLFHGNRNLPVEDIDQNLSQHM